MTARLGALALAQGLLLALAPTASAQDAPVDRTPEARALFDQGLERMDRGEWALAAGRFQQALELRSSAQITYNLALAFAYDGRIVRAAALMRRVAGDPEANAEARARAQSMLEELSPRLALVDDAAEPDRQPVSRVTTTEPRGGSAGELDASAVGTRSEDENVLRKWWLWAGVGAVVLGTVAVVLGLTLGASTPDPTDPHGRDGGEG